MDLLASGTMCGTHVEGLPSYPFPRKASKLFCLFLWKVPSWTMGDRFLGLQLWIAWMGTQPYRVSCHLASVTAPWARDH